MARFGMRHVTRVASSCLRPLPVHLTYLPTTSLSFLPPNNNNTTLQGWRCLDTETRKAGIYLAPDEAYGMYQVNTHLQLNPAPGWPEAAIHSPLPTPLLLLLSVCSGGSAGR